MTFDEKDKIEQALLRIEGMKETLNVIAIHLAADNGQETASRPVLSESIYAVLNTIGEQVGIIKDIVFSRGGGNTIPPNDPGMAKLLFILGKQRLPYNLRKVKSVYADQPDHMFGLCAVYNYGRIEGIRSERDCKKWNRFATVHNTCVYIKKTGKYPKNYQEVISQLGKKGNE